MVFARSLLHMIINKIPTGLAIEDPEGRYLLVNDAFGRMLGFTPNHMVGRLCEEFVAGDSLAQTREQYRRLRREEITAFTAERDAITADGELCRVRFDSEVVRDNDGYPLCVLTLVEDEETHLRQLDERLKLSKIEALSLLAGGVAHDLNNILQVVGANLELSTLHPGMDRGVSQFLGDALSATRRGSDLARKLQLYARGGGSAPRPTHLGDLLQTSVSFALKGSNVIARFAIDPALPPVEIDPTQITQVFDNIVINAREAMAQGGQLEIAARPVRLDPDNSQNLPPGSYVEITFTDSGPGVPPEILPRIFDPYVSSKSRSSGLGLATSQAILRRHDGAISVSQNPACPGARFTLLLPVMAPARAGLEKSPVDRSRTPQAAALPTGEGKILIVDDEVMILSILSIMLKKLGYEPVTALDGASGVALYRDAFQSGHPFRAVILDATIPGGLGGEAALRGFLSTDPQARVIICSGYSSTRVMTEWKSLGFVGRIEKPFEAAQIAELLHRVIQPAAMP